MKNKEGTGKSYILLLIYIIKYNHMYNNREYNDSYQRLREMKSGDTLLKKYKLYNGIIGGLKVQHNDH